MTQPPDVKVAALAATQAGGFARGQLLPLGLTDRMMEADGSLRRCATGAVRHCLHQGWRSAIASGMGGEVLRSWYPWEGPA